MPGAGRSCSLVLILGLLALSLSCFEPQELRLLAGLQGTILITKDVEFVDGSPTKRCKSDLGSVIDLRFLNDAVQPPCTAVFKVLWRRESLQHLWSIVSLLRHHCRQSSPDLEPAR